MNKLVIVLVLVVGIAIMPTVHGLAGSLEQLEEETTEDTNYKKELQDYLAAQNTTYGPHEGVGGNVNTTSDYFRLYQLEQIVRAHMDYCKNSTPEKLAENYHGYEFFYQIAGVNVFSNC